MPVTTIGGAPIPVDPHSEPQGDGADARFKRDEAAMALLEAPASLSDQQPGDFYAVFIPGGHGAVWALASSDEVAQFLSAIWMRGKVPASVWHGPAAFVGVEVDDEPLVKGRKVSAFTDSEEKGTGLKTVVPFLFETRLRELGADFQPGPDREPKAVQDGRLITGQKPMSSDKVAELLIAQLD